MFLAGPSRFAGRRPSQVREVGGVQVTSPVRTAYDLARRGDFMERVVAVDALANRHRFAPDLLLRFAVRYAGHAATTARNRHERGPDPAQPPPRRSRPLEGRPVGGIGPPPRHAAAERDKRQGVLQRHDDPDDRRRTIVAITDDAETRAAIEGWLANGATAWRDAFEPLSEDERATFVRTIRTYEESSGA
jgi:hypothetical protein